MPDIPSNFLAVIDHGDLSRALIFLHPGMGAKETWSEFPKILCAALKTSGIIYTRPEYERCGDEIRLPIDFIVREAGRLEAILADHGVQQAAIIGSSDGASIALEHAAQFPKRVRCIISIAAHVMIDTVMIAALERLRRETLFQPMPQWLFAQYGADAVKTATAWCDTWEVLMTSGWSMEGQLTKIECPVLAMQGTEDRNGMLDQLTAISSKVPDCTVSVLQGLGHFPFRQEPDALSDQVADFLRRHFSGAEVTSRNRSRL